MGVPPAVPASQVLVAWWTDPVGRKHVVFRGRRVEHHEARRLLHAEELEDRLPLWHAYPEYVYRVRVGKAERVVCACGCGAAGAPELLGWMGATCGPCSDRREEAGADALRANAPGVLHGEREPLGAVACAPDGTFVAAVEGEHGVTLWNTKTRERFAFEFPGMQPWDVAITPDARHLLVVGRGYPGTANDGLWAAIDLSAKEPARVKSARATDPPAIRVLARPDGRAVVHRLNPPEVNTFADMVLVPSGARERSVTLPAGALGGAALSQCGTKLATAGNRTVVIDLDTGKTVANAALTSSNVVAFGSDGNAVYGDFRESGLAAINSITGRAKGATPIADRPLFATTGPLKALAVDPGGAFVYAGTGEGWVVAFDAKSLAVRAAFEWHMGAVAGLAITADGTKLFSSGRDGCVKVWPIRDLMTCA
jgi:WD40 repeat protein